MFFKSSEIYNFIIKETPTQVFSCEFCEIFQNTYLIEHIRTATYDEFLIFKLSEKHFKNATTGKIKTWSSIFISTEHLKWFTLKKPTRKSEKKNEEWTFACAWYPTLCWVPSTLDGNYTYHRKKYFGVYQDYLPDTQLEKWHSNFLKLHSNFFKILCF